MAEDEYLDVLCEGNVNHQPVIHDISLSHAGLLRAVTAIIDATLSECRALPSRGGC